MPTKIEDSLSHEQLLEFAERVLATPGGKDSPTKIRALASEYGVRISKPAASAYRDGPLARYIERIERSKEISEALVNAAGKGTHGLDAVEEAITIELQDHLAQAGDVDLKFVTAQLLKLRMSISMREESRRKQTDLERKMRETEAKLELAEQQQRLRDEQIAKLTADREERARKSIAAKEILAKGATAAKAGLTPETLKRIEEAAALL